MVKANVKQCQQRKVIVRVAPRLQEMVVWPNTTGDGGSLVVMFTGSREVTAQHVRFDIADRD
jgi:hypothetical protein